MNNTDIVLRSRQSDEWETPEALFQDLDKEFHFDLDACATDENHKCEAYFTREQDGLEQNWEGHTVWCNPPYSQIKKWVRKCYYEGHKPNTTVVMIVPSRTDTQWFQNYVLHRAEIRFINGRVRFVGPGTIANAPFPSALICYRGPQEKIKKTKKDDRQITWKEFVNVTDQEHGEAE